MGNTINTDYKYTHANYEYITDDRTRKLALRRKKIELMRRDAIKKLNTILINAGLRR